MAQEDAKPPSLFGKITAIMEEVGTLERTGRNTGLRFDFIEYAMVAAKLRGLFAKHGVVLVPSMTGVEYFRDGKMVKVSMTFSIYNADDRTDCLEHLPWVGEAGAHDDKGIAKAKTSALKNFLLSLLLLSDKDDPDADDAPAPAPASRPPQQHASQQVVRGANSVDTATGEARPLATQEQVSRILKLQQALGMTVGVPDGVTQEQAARKLEDLVARFNATQKKG